ncbi:MAG TPA: peptidase M16 [Acidimicrobiaceae bacterium]|nr:peptidase M16 [Acidimicrobiaceae bacterium]HCV35977.1 peptidase M16 [Acidimicrobiaceae bacterium]
MVELTAPPDGSTDGPSVVSERMPDAHSVSVGVWVGVGGRDEHDKIAGASHFLEHLLFKGTDTRSSRSIAELVDGTGGEMNAFTAKEYTAFYARVPAGGQELATSLLCDVITSPALRSEDVDSERRVILEELNLAADDPDDVVGSLLYEEMFPDHPLGREVLGTSESVIAMQRDDIVDFHNRWYRSPNLVVAAAGDVDHTMLVDQVSEAFGDRLGVERPARSDLLTEAGEGRSVSRQTEAVHMAWGWRGLCRDDPRRHALSLGVHVLGGGLSSRLFQTVREDRGLAYSIFAGMSGYQDTGLVTVNAGTSPEKADELSTVIAAEVREVAGQGITAEELEIAKDGFEGSILLGLEGTGSRMARLGTSQSLLGRVLPLDEYVLLLREITLDDVNTVLAEVFTPAATTAQVGPSH